MGRNARRLFEERLCPEAFLESFQKLIRSPGPTSRRKRDAWAVQGGTETYVRKMGSYALGRDAQTIRDLIGLGPGRLLDMPCGTGRNFVRPRARVSGCRSRLQPDHVACGPAARGRAAPSCRRLCSPFVPESFDVILMPRLLFHYAKPESIIAALLPALKPGGSMVFDTLNTFSTRWLVSLLLHLFRRDPARRTYLESPPGFRRTLRTGLRGYPAPECVCPAYPPVPVPSRTACASRSRRRIAGAQKLAGAHLLAGKASAFPSLNKSPSVTVRFLAA